MEGVIALALNFLAFLGMQLVWFEGDQTSAQLPFFGLLVANVLLTAGVALRDSATSGVFRATGTFFLLFNLETTLCLLPPMSSNPLWNTERKDTAYAGGVLVLISVLASLVASYTNGFRGPAAGAGGRVASLRGATFLLASIFLLIASAVEWSWDEQCNATGRPSAYWYPVTNGILIVVAFIYIIAIVYGDNDTQNISVFLSVWLLLIEGTANPLFDSAITWPQESNFENKWKAAKGLSFIGVVLLLLSVIVTSKRKLIPSLTSLPYDFVAFAIALAGAICVFVRIPDNAVEKQKIEYACAFAIVITVLNLVNGVLGFDGAVPITTFFASAVLRYFDLGSQATTTGYTRGGLQLCQLGVLLSVFLKAFPVDQPLVSYVGGNKVATGFGLLWLLLAMLKVPDNYSLFILLAIITYRAVSSGDANWYRTSFYILSAIGVAGSFPLGTFQYFGITVNDYINSVGWVAAVYFLYEFALSGAKTSPALDLPDGVVADAVAAVENAAEKNEPTDAAASA